MKLKLPTWASVVLAVVAAALVYLNLNTFGFDPAWQFLVTIGLNALVAFGITPLSGPQLQAVLHLPHTTVLALATVLTTLVVGITQIHVSTVVQGIVIGIITIAQGVLFGTATPPPAVKAKTRARASTPARKRK